MADQDRKLFVGGLNITTDTKALNEYFSQFGEVTDAVVMTNPQTNRSKCFGFVSFSNRDVVDVVQSKRPHTIDGKTVDTKRAIPKEDPSPESRVPCKKLFIGGLKKSITQEQLQDYFSQYGNIVECQLILDKITNASRGFGFVTYEDTDSVDKVILCKPHSVGDSKADVKKALSREEMSKVNNKAPSGNTGGNNFNSSYGGGQQGFNGNSQAPWGTMPYGTGQQQPQNQQAGWGAAQQPYGSYGASNDYAAYNNQAQAAWGAAPWGTGGGNPYSAPAQGMNSVGGFGDAYQNASLGGGAMKGPNAGNRMAPY